MTVTFVITNSGSVAGTEVGVCCDSMLVPLSDPTFHRLLNSTSPPQLLPIPQFLSFEALRTSS